MANSYVQYTGNGATTLYTIPFGYLSRNHITVKLDGAVTTAFTYPLSTQIQFTVAPANGVAILIRRITPKTPFVDFNDGATETEANLDNAVNQAIYLAEETEDRAILLENGTLSYFEAGSKRITAVAAPTTNTDAATKGYVDGVVAGGGNVPGPLIGDVGKFLKATATAIYGWASVLAADIFDATATGRSLLTAATAAAARAVLGSTAAGDAIFTAASAAAQRTALGSTATGDAVFVAATAADARTAIASDNASNLTTGTVAAARLGSGAPTVNTMLLGNGVWTTLKPINVLVMDAATGTGCPGNTTENDLKSYTLPANTLVADGDLLRVTMSFRCAANTTTKRIQIKFGGTTLFDSSAIALNNQIINVVFFIVRTGAAAQYVQGAIIAAATHDVWSTGLVGDCKFPSDPAKALNATQIIKATITLGAGAAVNDVIQDMLIVEHLRQANA